MGYDYKPRNRKLKEWGRLNIWGHHEMYNILVALGERDFENWAGSNDGLYLPKKDCLRYATRLREGIPKLCYKEKKSRQAFDDQTEYRMITGKKEIIKIMLLDDNSGLWKPLEKERKEWILEFVMFLENCNGCWQY
jgi:hypothetical protein